MEIIPITEAKARIAVLADRVARKHDAGSTHYGLVPHFTIRRNGRADVLPISESIRETLDLLSDDEARADLRQSREDFVAGDTFSVDEVCTELKRRRSKTA
ncbi:type II toxin-antitoxin system Phd/YefM family antitoxin [Micromonospora sp. SH-82]|uniref:type II toxin-antitoxin system Phd/YefM family antitoxin n=1 Tax=Micromonospora sp. SH-82 TaxID=3132938 RepID=UPI003EBAEB48